MNRDKKSWDDKDCPMNGAEYLKGAIGGCEILEMRNYTISCQVVKSSALPQKASEGSVSFINL